MKFLLEWKPCFPKWPAKGSIELYSDDLTSLNLRSVHVKVCNPSDRTPPSVAPQVLRVEIPSGVTRRGQLPTHPPPQKKILFDLRQALSGSNYLYLLTLWMGTSLLKDSSQHSAQAISAVEGIFRHLFWRGPYLSLRGTAPITLDNKI